MTEENYTDKKLSIERQKALELALKFRVRFGREPSIREIIEVAEQFLIWLQKPEAPKKA